MAKSLVTLKAELRSSEELCCTEDNLMQCDPVTVSPELLLTGENINLLGTDLSFSNTVQPNGFTYRSKEGEEAVFTYNNRTGNMFGSFTNTKGESYEIQRCLHGHVIKQYEKIKQYRSVNLENEMMGVMRSHSEDYNNVDRNEIVTFSIKFY